jgi:serine protease DegQ
VRVATALDGGVLVVSVETGGPADTAGIRPGDAIVAIDKTPVPNTDELSTVLAEVKPGTKMRVDVIRKGKKLRFGVMTGQLRSG